MSAPKAGAKAPAKRQGIAGIGAVLKQEAPPIPFSFNVIGDRIEGVVIGARTQPLTDPDDNKPKRNYVTGQPIMQVLLVLQTEDDRKVLYVRGGVQDALTKAMAEAGVEDIALGDYVAMAYIGDGEPARAEWNAPKLYEGNVTPLASE